MFVFYHSKQNSENKSFYKGTLFEQLLKEYLEKLGYKVELRKKQNSLEYDIEGTSSVTRRKIIGEAKAHASSISGEIIASFVGKLLPLGIIEKKVDGLFLSTSPLTSEAENYFNSIQQFDVSCYCGKDLYSSIFEKLKLPSLDCIKIELEDMQLMIQSDNLLISDLGYFIALLISTSESVTPTYLLLVNKYGQKISDVSFVENIIENCQEFTGLKPFITNLAKQETEKRVIEQGLLVGESWLDYRLPAGPNYFVGRTKIINEILKSIFSCNSSNIIQIKSRSGVGKSSTLSMIADKLKKNQISVELHDIRNIKNIMDFNTVIRRFTGASYTPQDLRDVEDLINKYVMTNPKDKSVFMVDQFESSFFNTEVFSAYESLSQIFLKYPKNLFIIFARKNDQLTTFDETKISLERLNSISKSYVLSDFSRVEAGELIRNINKSSDVKIGQDILSYVLEFAQGFPWLLKRTMSHIVKLINQPVVHQDELFAVGLRLDDLFEEELDGLDEIEKDYLLKIAKNLPADVNQLQKIFDEDPFLIKVLDKLTQMRLIRMSGSTYDTYNDVFKEYLIYKRIPEFKQTVIYRAYPNRIIASFLKVIDKESFSNLELEEILCLKRGSMFNFIKEWRNLNLIERNGDGWVIPNKVFEAYEKKSLGAYIRKQILDNDVVIRLLKQNSVHPFFEIEIPEFIKEQFPFVQASKDTWELYSTILKSWLISFKIITINKEHKLEIVNYDRDEINKSLSNLENFGSPMRKTANLFFPSSSWKYLKAVFQELMQGKTTFTGEKQKAFTDLKNIGIIQDKKLLFTKWSDCEEYIKKKISGEPYSIVWEGTKTNSPLLQYILEIIPIDVSEETAKWRLKKLLNWGKNLKIIQDKRYRY